MCVSRPRNRQSKLFYDREDDMEICKADTAFPNNPGCLDRSAVAFGVRYRAAQVGCRTWPERAAGRGAEDLRFFLRPLSRVLLDSREESPQPKGNFQASVSFVERPSRH